jgi:CRP-like cAMP-binding protein
MIERLAVLGPGRLFGEMALIDDQPRMASARAHTNCVLVLINTEMLSGKISKSDPLVRELINNFILNLREMARQHVVLTAANASTKR